jgi:hypothetical protein
MFINVLKEIIWKFRVGIKYLFDIMECQIFIKDPSNKTWVMFIDNNTMPIDCLRFVDSRVEKSRLIEFYEMGKIKFNFITSGKYLDNGVLLVEQGVKKETTLYLSIKPVKGL